MSRDSLAETTNLILLPDGRVYLKSLEDAEERLIRAPRYLGHIEDLPSLPAWEPEVRELEAAWGVREPFGERWFAPLLSEMQSHYHATRGL